MVEVTMVQPDQLPVPWVNARSEDGRHVLFVRDDASLDQMLAGYERAQRAAHAA